MILKCKMCGGDLDVQEKAGIATCLFCGTKQTMPKATDDKRANLYERANHFRRQNEFDKAVAIYETILNEDRSDAEAYWSLLLCKFGVVYVEDPASRQRIPTCNRTQLTSVLADEDYKQALAHANDSQRGLYEAEARAIDAIQKGILEISSKEEPFDIFICYKETDEGGRRTPDSVLAQEMYHQLSNEGFKVFFSRITLEGILGSAYEPYIFAALQSARAMVVVGTKPEYFNAVWVKNEWSRYLGLIKGDPKKTLIPAYKDMDPYNLPQEFANRQAQDMGKLGFMQDLVRGIKKILSPAQAAPAAAPAAEARPLSANETTMLKRIGMFLTDNDVDSADQYCAKVLDSNPDNTLAYFYKIIIDYRKNIEDSKYGRRLESMLPEPSAEEKAFIDGADQNQCAVAFIKAGAVSRLKYTLEKYPAVLKYSVPDKTTPTFPLLSFAIMEAYQFPAGVKAILEAGADVKAFRTPQQGDLGISYYSPLADAIWKAKSPELVKMLLDHGANPNTVDNVIFEDGTRSARSMLTFAVQNSESLEIVKLLLDNGADIKSGQTTSNKYGQTQCSAFMDAVNNNHYDIAELMLTRGADPNTVIDIIYDDGTRCTKSALTLAITAAKNSNMIELLCRHGANWNAKIKWSGVKKLEKNFPYHKHLSLSKDFAAFLRQKGWRGNSVVPKLIGFGVIAAIAFTVVFATIINPTIQRPAGKQTSAQSSVQGAAKAKTAKAAKQNPEDFGFKMPKQRKVVSESYRMYRLTNDDILHRPDAKAKIPKGKKPDNNVDYFTVTRQALYDDDKNPREENYDFYFGPNDSPKAIMEYVWYSMDPAAEYKAYKILKNDPQYLPGILLEYTPADGKIINHH